MKDEKSARRPPGRFCFYVSLTCPLNPSQIKFNTTSWFFIGVNFILPLKPLTSMLWRKKIFKALWKLSANIWPNFARRRAIPAMKHLPWIITSHECNIGGSRREKSILLLSLLERFWQFISCRLKSFSQWSMKERPLEKTFSGSIISFLWQPLRANSNLQG